MVAAVLLAAGCSAGAVAPPAPSAPTGSAGPGLDHFDAVALGLLPDFQIPGAGFAIAYQGRLVLARGYGLADAVYSNYGYMLLGLIVERAGGQRYAPNVGATTLQPMGIADMVDGAGRARYVPDEARRYGPDGRRDPRGGLPPVHFASGAWIGSAVDLARFLVVIGGSRPPRFLSAATWQQMLAPPPLPPGASGAHFGMGWDVVEQTPAGPFYHKDGGVLGTTTWIEHDPRGVDWALLFNASKGRPEGPELHQEFQRELRAAIQRTPAWPDVDLFDRYR